MNPIEYLEELGYRVTSDPTQYDSGEWGLRNYHKDGRNQDEFCDGYHRAYDLSNYDLAPVFSVTDGHVVKGTHSHGNFGGTVVIVDKKGDYQYIYGHLAREILVDVGDEVRQGDVIGYQSNTNYNNIPMSSHLHLQIQEAKYYPKEKDFVCNGIDPRNIDVMKYTEKDDEKMGYAFENLPQTVDKRGKLTEHRSRGYKLRTQPLAKLERGIHHSLTVKDAAGSSPEGFSRYHVNTLGWPAIGYPITIQPNKVIDTPNGPRAMITYNVDLRYETYHVGNSNWISLGICVAGDYRTDKLDGPTMASLVDLLNALDEDKIAMGGMYSHHQYPGYAWKKCCVFDPQYAVKKGKEFIESLEVKPNPVAPVPSVYTVQEGDTLWSIANNDDRFDVEDLKKWNNISDPTKLRVGQPLKLKDVNFSDETDDGWVHPKNGLSYRKEKAVFTNTSGSRIAARDGYPNLNREIAAWLNHGETFTYDRVYVNAGYVWISKAYKGKRRFLPVRTHKNGVDGEAWGNFS